MLSTPFPTLYKKSSKGKTQQWNIWAEETVSGAIIVVEHGQLDGKIQTATVKVEGKNIGKSNETIPYEQAVSEAQSKWKHQKDKGYSEDINAAVEIDRRPMLAHKFSDYSHKLTFPSFVQRKYEGQRCIIYKNGLEVVLMSRGNKPIDNMEHVAQAFKDIPNDAIFDGELYVHGKEFQEIMSWIKKRRPESVLVEYHCYDMIDSKLSFAQRQLKLKELLPKNNLVKLVETYEISNEDDISDYHNEFINGGYEGSIIRVGDCPYTAGFRSQQLLKMKDFEDAEFEIVDVVNGKGKCERQAIFVCKTSDGTQFRAKIKGSDEIREQILLDKTKYFGKMVTVRYFEMTTSLNPVPRFPVALSFCRDYE